MNDLKALDGHCALVTGGGGGIGSASAAELARDGATVTIMGRSEGTLLEAKERIKSLAGQDAKLRRYTGDALDSEQLQEALRSAIDPTGRLDVVVACVGGGHTGMIPILMFDESDIIDILRMHRVSASLAIRQSTPFMARQGGPVVCISSAAAKRARRSLSMYSASKAGLEVLVQVAALELAPLKIRVNAVRPGLTLSPAVVIP
jgi:NAD(P)-dependent dehydrogenase (short-subunit alcohol dehydrogenase family)